MPKWAALAALVICLALAGPAVGPLQAAPIASTAGDVKVGAVFSFSPAAAVIHGCETIPVEVWVNDAAALYGADVKISFDKNVLEVVDADPGKDDVQIMPGTFLHPDFVVHDEADNTAGSPGIYGEPDRFFAASERERRPVHDSFRAKSSATASALHFTQAQLTDLDGLLLPVTLVDNTVTTVAPAAPSELDIAKLNASDVQLFWGDSLGVANYHLYRKTLPYFVPVNPAHKVTTDLSVDDLGAWAYPDDNYYYVVESACANDFHSGPFESGGGVRFCARAL